MEGNQYRIDCFVRSSPFPTASSEVASYPLLAKEARAASRMRSLVVELGTYQMVDRIGGQW